MHHALGAVHKVGPTSRYFGPILTPPSVTLCHTSRDPPKVRHTSRTPRFLLVHAYIHMSLQRVCLSSREFLFGQFCLGFLSGRFCPSLFCRNTSVTTGI